MSGELTRTVSLPFAPDARCYKPQKFLTAWFNNKCVVTPASSPAGVCEMHPMPNCKVDKKLIKWKKHRYSWLEKLLRLAFRLCNYTGCAFELKTSVSGASASKRMFRRLYLHIKWKTPYMPCFLSGLTYFLCIRRCRRNHARCWDQFRNPGNKRTASDPERWCIVGCTRDLPGGSRQCLNEKYNVLSIIYRKGKKIYVEILDNVHANYIYLQMTDRCCIYSPLFSCFFSHKRCFGSESRTFSLISHHANRHV